jgi:hypothetical protein
MRLAGLKPCATIRAVAAAIWLGAAAKAARSPREDGFTTPKRAARKVREGGLTPAAPA